MSAHRLLNKLGKGDKMRGLPRILSLFRNEFNKFKPRILSLFRNEFNKFNNTGACMLDYNYHMTLKLVFE